VRNRVKVGGHNVNPDVIRERYVRGLALLRHYKSFPDVLILLDNTEELKMFAALYKGVGIKKVNNINWIESVMTDPPKKESLEGKSIEEILRLYKRKKDR
jgi:predicted ABC-type ATPase